LHTAAVRRLTGNEHLSSDFASTWRQYDLDEKTRELLAYAQKVTEAPAMIGDGDIDRLRDAGWDERGIYEASVLISFFNMTGRIESISGLPPDEVPEESKMAEAVHA
jgi:uncharacterized peroxidase-related enzyme